jgi:phage shock protein PspC (stress-responsive transcriptional regulator)
MPAPMTPGRRDHDRRVNIAGVCRGIARTTASEVRLRLLFVIFAILGASEIAHLGLWVQMLNGR